MPKKLTSTQAELDAANNGMELDPLVNALLEHLPAPGDVFTPDERKLWLQMMELAFKLVYLEAEPEHGEQPHGGQT